MKVSRVSVQRGVQKSEDIPGVGLGTQDVRNYVEFRELNPKL